MGIESTPLEQELANRIEKTWKDINGQVSNIFKVIDFLDPSNISQEDFMANISFPLNNAIKQCEFESKKLFPNEGGYGLYLNRIESLKEKLIELKSIITLLTFKDIGALKDQEEKLKVVRDEVTASVDEIMPKEEVLAA